MRSTDHPDVQSASNCPVHGADVYLSILSIRLESRRRITYAFVMTIPFRITVAEFT